MKEVIILRKKMIRGILILTISSRGAACCGGREVKGPEKKAEKELKNRVENEKIS